MAKKKRSEGKKKKKEEEKPSEVPRQKRAIIHYVRESVPMTRAKTAEMEAEAQEKRAEENQSLSQKTEHGSKVHEAATERQQLPQPVIASHEASTSSNNALYKADGQGISFVRTNSKKIRAMCHKCGITVKMQPLSDVMLASFGEESSVSENRLPPRNPRDGKSCPVDQNVSTPEQDVKCETVPSWGIPRIKEGAAKNPQPSAGHQSGQPAKGKNFYANDGTPCLFDAVSDMVEDKRRVRNVTFNELLPSTSFPPETGARKLNRKRAFTEKETDKVDPAPCKRRAGEKEILNEEFPNVMHNGTANRREVTHYGIDGPQTFPPKDDMNPVPSSSRIFSSDTRRYEDSDSSDYDEVETGWNGNEENESNDRNAAPFVNDDGQLTTAGISNAGPEDKGFIQMIMPQDRIHRDDLSGPQNVRESAIGDGACLNIAEMVHSANELPKKTSSRWTRKFISSQILMILDPRWWFT